MKNIFNILICLIVLFLFGCSPPSEWQENLERSREKTIAKSISKDKGWEIWTNIKATLNTKNDGQVIITYHLGPVLIVDDIQVSKSWVHFIRSDDPLYMRVHVSEDRSGDCSRGLFKYYVEENFINPTSCCSPIDFSALERNADEIPGFIWNDGRISQHRKL